ncbi:hypothetical protein [Micromonospora carbonacea]|uniref:hypothetical protein n=1 Tax=Micromonospora carbonacea TaxID=47853 RepID=UPI003D7533B6
MLDTQQHDQRLVGRLAAVDGSIRFGWPQLHFVLFEQRHQGQQLVPEEGASTLMPKNPRDGGTRVVRLRHAQPGLGLAGQFAFGIDQPIGILRRRLRRDRWPGAVRVAAAGKSEPTVRLPLGVARPRWSAGRSLMRRGHRPDSAV